MGETIGVGDVFWALNLDDISGRAAETHGGKTGNQDILIDFHSIIVLETWGFGKFCGFASFLLVLL